MQILDDGLRLPTFSEVIVSNKLKLTLKEYVVYL